MNLDAIVRTVYAPREAHLLYSHHAHVPAPCAMTILVMPMAMASSSWTVGTVSAEEPRSVRGFVGVPLSHATFARAGRTLPCR